MRSIVLAMALLAGCGGSGPPAPRPDASTDGGDPTLPAACGAPRAALVQTIRADAVLDVAAAAAPAEIGVAFVDRASDTTLVLRLSRLAPDGVPIGAPIEVARLGSGFGAGAAIATDGARYVVCGNGTPDGVSCAVVPVGGSAATAGATIPDATAPALAFGAGGFLLAYSSGGEISVQALDADARLTGGPRFAAADAGPPSLAPTEAGYVLGYASSAAFVQELDASGAPSGAPRRLGDAQRATMVAVTGGARVGAAWIDADQDAIALLEGRGLAVVGPGAGGLGRVSIARAADGLFASFSDAGGFVGVAALGPEGRPLGAGARVSVGWNDAAHALVASSEGLLLVTSTTPSLAPLEIHALACP